MLLHELTTASAAVAGASGRLAKIERLADVLRRVPAHEVAIAIAFLSGEPRQGRIGIGTAAIREARPTTSSTAPTLSLADVDEAFARIAATTGQGAAVERVRLLRALLEHATRPEQDFLVRLLFGELRQGAVEGVLIEATARAGGASATAVRRAAMMAGALAPVARALLVEGRAGLDAFAVQPLRPVQPMLAQTAAGLGDALTDLEEDAALEWKIDGARIQVHKAGDIVRAYSRNLREVTPAVPEIVEAMQRLPAHDLILDGEVIALRRDGTPEPFQKTMQRFGRRLDVERLRAEMPLTPFYFDLLYLNGSPLIDRPRAERFGALGEVMPSAIVPSLDRPDRASAERFAADALGRGHEGVMVKALGSPYAAGRRGQQWLKVKVARTLDLVVLAAEWGHGRRRGWLSNLHLGARDTARGGFVMLGKTFKGMTDQMLAWQTGALLERELARDAHTVFVRPELVVEVAFNDVQASPHYPGGLALRFARVKRYRTDKPAAAADTIDAVREIYRRATGLEPSQGRDV